MTLTLIKLDDDQWVNPSDISAIVTVDMGPGRPTDAVVSLTNGEKLRVRRSSANGLLDKLREAAAQLAQHGGQVSQSSDLLAVGA